MFICTIGPPLVSVTQPLLLDCVYVPLVWHISISFIIKENSFHIWLSNSEGLSQLEVTINCWAVTHFIVGYHLLLISNKVAAGGVWQESSSFFLVGEIKKKERERQRDIFMNHASCLLPRQGNYLLYTTINTIDLCHKKQVTYIYIPLKVIILQSLLQYY